MQTIHQLPDETAVKLTTARYYTPNDRSIQAKGIVPDMTVEEYADGDGLNEFRVREADLQKHLTNDKDLSGDAANKPKKDEMEEELRIAAQEKKRKPLEYGSKEDFQLAQALNYLKGKTVQLAKEGGEGKKAPDAAAPKAGTPVAVPTPVPATK